MSDNEITLSEPCEVPPMLFHYSMEDTGDEPSPELPIKPKKSPTAYAGRSNSMEEKPLP